MFVFLLLLPESVPAVLLVEQEPQYEDGVDFKDRTA